MMSKKTISSLLMIFVLIILLFSYLNFKQGKFSKRLSATFYSDTNIGFAPIEPTIFPDNEKYPSSPSEVVFNYYLWALSCMNNHFWNTNKNPSYPNQTVSARCNGFKSRYLSVTSTSKNSLICNYEPPSGFSVRNEIKNTDNASVYLDLNYLRNGTSIQIELRKENNDWEISREICSGK